MLKLKKDNKWKGLKLYSKRFLLALILFLILLTGCTNEYTVSVNIMPENAGEIKGSGVYQSGEQVDLKATSYEEYNFIGWEDQDNLIEQDKNYEFKIEEDVNLVARFKKKKFNLEIENNNKDMGLVKGEGEYLINEKATLSATPNDNHKFIGWFNTNNELISEKEIFKLLINSNTKVVAKFKPMMFNITLDKNIDKGEIFGEGKYNKGKKQFIRAERLEGYEFKHWLDRNGNIFSKKDGKMITVSEDLNLTAIYEKKEQQFYLGISEDEILEILQNAYGTYFWIRDQHYASMWGYEKTEEMMNLLSEGKYYISTQPNSFIKHSMNDGNPIEFKVKNIEIIGNEIIVNSIIKIPKLENGVDKLELKNKIKDNIIKINQLFSSYLEYDNTQKNIYEKELRLKVIDDEIIITHFDKPGDIFSKYQKIFNELVYDSIDEINIQVENGMFSNIIYYYDGKKYIKEYSNEIFDNRDLYPKINIVFNNGITFNFQDFYKNLRSDVDKSLIVDNQLFDDISFYQDEINNHLIISIESCYGMNPHLIFSFYDIKNKKFLYSERIPGWLKEGLITNSPNDEYISYVYSDSSSTEKLEILNIMNNQRVLVNDFLDEYDIKLKNATIFKNIQWSKESSGLTFDLYLKIHGNRGREDKTLNIGRFNFDLETKKISRIISKVNDSESDKEIIKYNPYSEKNLTSVKIPEATKHIGKWAFYGNRLTTLEIPDSVITIGNSAFYNNKLITLKLPHSITTIGDSAFYNNELTSVEIPNSVSHIGKWAFGNNSLKSVKIPNSVNAIDKWTFYNNDLEAISIPESVTSIGYSAFSENSLTAVTIPESVTLIGTNAFRNNNLKSVKIPDSVTLIGYSAFRGNSLKTVEIPSGCSYKDNSFDDDVQIIQK